MRILILLAMAAAPVSAAGAPPLHQGPATCPKPAKAPGKAEFKRLNELPPAIAFNAVLRQDGGCPANLVQARDRLGSFPQKSR